MIKGGEGRNQDLELHAQACKTQLCLYEAIV